MRAGFFANADADAKARGEKPAKPRSKDEQFTDFMASIAADVKEAQVHDEEEAAAEAAERAERELFEQRCAALTLQFALLSTRESKQTSSACELQKRRSVLAQAILEMLHVLLAQNFVCERELGMVLLGVAMLA